MQKNAMYSFAKAKKNMKKILNVLILADRIFQAYMAQSVLYITNLKEKMNFVISVIDPKQCVNVSK